MLLVLGACAEQRNLESDMRIQPPKETKKPIRTFDLSLVGLGDSLTEGVGDSSELKGYINRLPSFLEKNEAIESVTVSNHAKKGRTSQQLLHQLQTNEELRQAVREADIIAMTIGGNDIMAIMRKHLLQLSKTHFDQDLPAFKNRLETIFEVLETLNLHAKIVLTGIYNPAQLVIDEQNEFSEVILDWNSSMQSVIAEKPDKRLFVEIEDITYSSNPEVYAEDYFHPNPSGYQWIAEQWQTQFLDWMNESEAPEWWNQQ